ncbi:hypothetical protein [Butyricimonas hominis]|uniref:hypothetical protein n=1 Tax=Butyricimonas hominis TaxID=2763032 RepID=UPI00344E825A
MDDEAVVARLEEVVYRDRRAAYRRGIFAHLHRVGGGDTGTCRAVVPLGHECDSSAVGVRGIVNRVFHVASAEEQGGAPESCDDCFCCHRLFLVRRKSFMKLFLYISVLFAGIAPRAVVRECKTK